MKFSLSSISISEFLQIFIGKGTYIEPPNLFSGVFSRFYCMAENFFD